MQLDKTEQGLVNWLLLDLNSFFASCEQQANPSLRNKPIGIVPMMGVDTTCLLAASIEAKRFGLKTGTSVRDAKSLCPEIILVPACHKKYIEYHHRILEAIETCTPVTHILSIDEVACQLTGSQRINENAMMLGYKIKHAIKEMIGEYLTTSIGIAQNILLSKLASDLQKPNGLVILTSTDIPEKIKHLKITDFSGIGPRMKQRFYRYGIFNMNDLYNTNREKMRIIWGGIEGERFYLKLRGLNIIREVSQKRVIGHQHVLEPELRNHQGSYDVLHHLLIKAAERLRRYHFYCKKMSLVIKLDRHGGYWWRETNFTETQDTAFLLSRLRELYADYPQHAKALRIGVTLHQLIPENSHQFDLFHQASTIRRKPNIALLESVDRLNTKFGRHSVTFGLNPYVTQRAGKDKIAFNHVPEARDT